MRRIDGRGRWKKNLYILVKGVENKKGKVQKICSGSTGFWRDPLFFLLFS